MSGMLFATGEDCFCYVIILSSSAWKAPLLFTVGACCKEWPRAACGEEPSMRQSTHEAVDAIRVDTVSEKERYVASVFGVFLNLGFNLRDSVSLL